MFHTMNKPAGKTVARPAFFVGGPPGGGGCCPGSGRGSGPAARAIIHRGRAEPNTRTQFAAGPARRLARAMIHGDGKSPQPGDYPGSMRAGFWD